MRYLELYAGLCTYYLRHGFTAAAANIEEIIAELGNARAERLLEKLLKKGN